MYVVYSICLYFFCQFFCSHTIKIIFPKKNSIIITNARFGKNLGKLHVDQFANDVICDLSTNKERDTKQMYKIFNTKTSEYLKCKDNV